MPRINDYLLSKQTKENSYRSSICPTYKMIDLSAIPKMPKEVLFFMFYIHKGETEQYLAAK
jgi:CCR4-NOT transcriptional regulation complex NOT5 subunit